MIRTVLELVLAPVLVGGATAADRRWGPSVAGLLSAFPAVVGPLLLVSAQAHGPAFAARAANGTLLGLTSLAAFAFTYSHVAQRASWRTSLLAGWSAAAVIAILAGAFGGGIGFPSGLLAAVVALTVAFAAMPAALPTASDATGPSLGRHEVLVRMGVTALLIAVLAGAAALFGALIGGMLAALPVLASVLAVFTHRRRAEAEVAALLRGMVGGLSGFVGFCAVVALLLVPAGTALAFAAATLTALGFQLLGLSLAPRPYAPATEGG